MNEPEIMEQFTTAHEEWDELRALILKKVDDSVCNEDALTRLFIESGTVFDAMEQWGKRLEDELDDYQLEQMDREAMNGRQDTLPESVQESVPE